MTGVFPIKAKNISYGSSESIKTLNRRLHWGRRGIVHQHDPRHVDVLVLEHGNSVPMFVHQSRSSRQNVHCERVVSKDVESQSTELCQAEEACQMFET